MFDLTALCVENSTGLSYIDIGIVAVVLLFAVPATVKGLCGGLERGCFGQFLGVVLSLALGVVLVFGVKGVGPFLNDFPALDGIKSQVSQKIESANPKYSAQIERNDDGILYVTDEEGNSTSVARVFVPVENDKVDQVVEALDKLVAASFSDETLSSYESGPTIGKLLGETVIKLLLFVVCFVAGIVVCTAFSYLFGILKKSLDDSSSVALKVVDKFLGLLTGVALGAMLAIAATAILAAVVQFKPIEAVSAQFEQSTIAKYVYDFVAKLFENNVQ